MDTTAAAEIREFAVDPSKITVVSADPRPGVPFDPRACMRARRWRVAGIVADVILTAVLLLDLAVRWRSCGAAPTAAAAAVGQVR